MSVFQNSHLAHPSSITASLPASQPASLPAACWPDLPHSLTHSTRTAAALVPFCSPSHTLTLPSRLTPLTRHAIVIVIVELSIWLTTSLGHGLVASRPRADTPLKLHVLLCSRRRGTDLGLTGAATASPPSAPQAAPLLHWVRL